MVESILGESGSSPGDRVLELAAGDGALTLPLAESGVEVVGIEIDRDLASELSERLEPYSNARVLEGDVTELDYRELLRELGWTSAAVLGNLPYNRASRILLRLSDVSDLIDFGLFMIQKEVAGRIIARPGGKDYGALSVLLRRRFRAEWVMKVSPGAFSPPPRVDSAVIKLSPRENPFSSGEEEMLFRKIVRFTFQERRKTLRNTLTKFFGLGPEAESAIEVEAGIDLGRRPETLTRAEFLALAAILRGRGIR